MSFPESDCRLDLAGRLRAVCFFFFASRRRHTRLVSDWSSDVCSSDLGQFRTRFDPHKPPGRAQQPPFTPEYQALFEANLKDQEEGGQGSAQTFTCVSPRSEERRVGKECRTRWAQERSRKNRTETRSGR